MKPTHKAQRAARNFARINDYDPEKVRRYVDITFPIPFPCWIVTKTRKWAIVVYEDDPEAALVVENHAGRFLLYRVKEKT